MNTAFQIDDVDEIPVQKIEISPQKGPQTEFLSTKADVAIYGGAAGGGKTYSLLLEPLRHFDNRKFGCVIFRRNSTQVRNEGGLWDESRNLYAPLGAHPQESYLKWTFPSGMRVKFSHLEQDKDVLNHQGSQVAMIGFDELTHFCLTPDHEVLTENGWKNITEVSQNDFVASLSPTREIQYKPVLATPSFDFDGEIINCFQKSGVSFRATPNHEMVVRRQDRKKSLGKKRLDKWGHDSIERQGKWKSEEYLEGFSPCIPEGRGHGRNANNAKYVEGDDWIEFLGWYISEGCAFRMAAGKKSCVVSIRQTNEKGKEKIRATLNKLPWRYTETNDGQFKIFSRQLYDILKPMGNSYQKRVPRWLLKCSVRQLKIFWEAFVDGDGHRQKSGGITIGLANDGLIDDLQEIAFKIGLIGTKGQGITKTGYFYSSLNVSSPKRSVCMVKNEQLKKEKYVGPVHCLTVADNHNFLIRHRGRVCWSGNSSYQFFYMLSRNRSVSGVPGYVRATCNPDVDSWVRQFIDWYIDKDGWPIPNRSGVLRWFIRQNDEVLWGDTKEELERIYGKESMPKSFTFIPSSVYDNKILLDKDPAYLANLKALPRVERLRLLGGNWNVRASAGDYFQREWFPILETVPAGWRSAIRFWDRAATKPSPENPNPDWTRGLKLYSYPNGTFLVADLKSTRDNPGQVEKLVRTVAAHDTPSVRIMCQQDPGSAGVKEAESFIRMLAGYDVKTSTFTKNKETRAKPVSAQVEAGNIYVLRAPWNEEFFSELENFPKGAHDDIVDCLSGAFNALVVDHGILDVL